MDDDRNQLAPVVVETHISTVVFIGDRAYKFMKPIATAFLDQSTPELRRSACENELALNRRIAPDVYLGIGQVQENGVVTDHFLVMRRLPSDRRLSALVGRDELGERVREVARAVASFHLRQPPSPLAADVASADAVNRLWTSNIDELLELGDVIGADELEDVRAMARRYLEGRRPLFAQRIADGWARDGHGDLLADDIFALPDGPRILDCLAFDERLRCGDVLLDIAFLAMDLERLGAPVAGDNLFDWYSEFTHERHPRSLADFYVAYRALVRTKINVLRAKQDRADAAEAAQRFFALCRRRLAAALPVVVMVGGSPGTGKSTIARALAERLDLVALSSDEVRKELIGLPHHEHAYAAPGEGIYTTELNEQTYAELLRRSRHALAMGEPVVLDASWSRERDRQAVRVMADEVAVPVIEIRCEIDAAVARTRIESRMRTSTASDATPEVAAYIASVFESWPEATSIDTSGDLESTTARALDVVRAQRSATSTPTD